MARLKVPEPVSNLEQPRELPTPPIEEHAVIGVDSLMVASLPPIMSGADVYMRQFYRGPKLPQRRYLPLRGV